MNAEELLESLSRLVGVVVRNLGGDVVRDVGGCDLVKELKKEKAKRGTRSAKKKRVCSSSERPRLTKVPTHPRQGLSIVARAPRGKVQTELL